jgi:hypothetical protein
MFPTFSLNQVSQGVHIGPGLRMMGQFNALWLINHHLIPPITASRFTPEGVDAIWLNGPEAGRETLPQHC